MYKNSSQFLVVFVFINIENSEKQQIFYLFQSILYDTECKCIGREKLMKKLPHFKLFLLKHVRLKLFRFCLVLLLHLSYEI